MSDNYIVIKTIKPYVKGTPHKPVTEIAYEGLFVYAVAVVNEEFKRVKSLESARVINFRTSCNNDYDGIYLEFVEDVAGTKDSVMRISYRIFKEVV